MFCTKTIIYGYISELQRHAYSPLTHQHKETIHDTVRKLTRCRGVQDPSKLACTNKECGLSSNCRHMPIISSENGITHAQDDTSCLTIKLLGNMKLTKQNFSTKDVYYYHYLATINNWVFHMNLSQHRCLIIPLIARPLFLALKQCLSVILICNRLITLYQHLVKLNAPLVGIYTLMRHFLRIVSHSQTILRKYLMRVYLRESGYARLFYNLARTDFCVQECAI